MQCRWRAVSGPRRRKDGRWDERYRGAKARNSEGCAGLGALGCLVGIAGLFIKGTALAVSEAEAAKERRDAEQERRMRAIAGQDGRAISACEQVARTIASRGVLAQVPLAVRASRGDPAALAFVAAQYLNSGAAQERLALDVYALACAAGRPEPICAPTEIKAWAFMLSRAQAGEPAAMYAVAIGLERHARVVGGSAEAQSMAAESAKWMGLASGSGLPAARIHLALGDLERQLKAVLVQALGGNLFALELLSGGHAISGGTVPASVDGIIRRIPAATMFPLNAVRFAWLCDAAGVPSAKADPLRLGMAMPEASGDGGIDDAPHSLRSEWVRRESLRARISERERADACRRAAAMREIAVSGLARVSQSVPVLSVITAGTYGIAWYARFIDRASAVIGAFNAGRKSGQAEVRAADAVVPRPWPFPLVLGLAAVYAGALLLISMLGLGWLGYLTASPRTGREGVVAVAVMTFLVMAAGGVAGFLLLQRGIALRSWLLAHGECRTRTWTRGANLGLWIGGWLTAWLFIGIPVLAVQGVAFVVQARAILEELAGRRPQWFAWTSLRVPAHLSRRIAADFGRRTA